MKYIKYLFSIRWLSFYFQRLFLQKPIREIVSKLVVTALRIVRRHHKMVSPESNGVTLQSKGILFLDPSFSKDQLDSLSKYFKEKEVYDPYASEARYFPIPLDGALQKFHIAHHRPEDVLKAPYLLQFANNPYIIGIAEEFLGTKPTIGYMAAWWSFPTGLGAQHAENFHRDVDDWKFLKLFIYLSDVGADSGPHVYIQESASSKFARGSIRRFTDEEVLSVFGEDKKKVIQGEAGSAFFEDTFGLHKGQPVRKGNRLVAQVVYSLSALPYSPKRPLLTMESLDTPFDFDPWINRVYLFSRH